MTAIDWLVPPDYIALPSVLDGRQPEVVHLGESEGMVALCWLRGRGGTVGPVRLCRRHRTLAVPVEEPVPVGRWRSRPVLECGGGRRCDAQMWLLPGPARECPGLTEPYGLTEALFATGSERQAEARFFRGIVPAGFGPRL
ncbi:hypothetical protein [Streptomyces sp. MP131-18]|uniref:hypothetical protein n=1 Tax=Streptomyces sp. MP131-18 TaxID=1857892 RepID=UPI00097BDECB|nr:hypothetical protein [Streptomyces sp. MP131-18]ONK13217.1 hypothetical protein STBA_39800 [Streptomyces sp. MP131-18]